MIIKPDEKIYIGGLSITNLGKSDIHIGVSSNHPNYYIDEKMGSVEPMWEFPIPEDVTEEFKESLKEAMDSVRQSMVDPVPQSFRDIVEKDYPDGPLDEEQLKNLMKECRDEREEEDEGLEKLAKAFGWEDSMIQLTGWDREQIRKWAAQMYEHRWTLEHNRALNKVTEVKKGTPHQNVAVDIINQIGDRIIEEKVERGLRPLSNPVMFNFVEPTYQEMEEKFRKGNVLLQQYSCNHEWINTGFKKSWCKLCNMDKGE